MKKISVFDEAKQGKRLLNIFVTLILGVVIIFGGSLIGSFLVGLFPASLLSNNLWSMVLNHTLGFLPVTILVILVVKFLEGRPLSSIGLRKERFYIKFLFGFLFGFLSFTAVILILLASGTIAENPDTSLVKGASAAGPVIFIILAWIVQSGTEEIFSRGWMLTSIGAKYNKVLAIVVSSLFFSALHLTSGEVSMIAAINIALAGMLLAIYVVQTDDLWGAIGWHTAWNWSQGCIYGFEVSGNDLKLPSIFQLHSVGSDFVTGGAFGPEAGIAATVILLAISGLLIWKKPWFAK